MVGTSSSYPYKQCRRRLEAVRLAEGANHGGGVLVLSLDGVVEAAADCVVVNQEWLRSAHRSHVPAPGPFSVCVHRPDTATVSCTEVKSGSSRISMR
jgi:hypothetical protein